MYATLARRGLSLVSLTALLVVSNASAAGPFIVRDSDFVGGVYEFHYYTFPNTAADAIAKRTVINGVDQGITDPTMTNSGWEFGDPYSGAIGFWGAIGPFETIATSGAVTMGWDFSAISGRIAMIELKPRHYLFQFGEHIQVAVGDEIAGFVATPPSFGGGSFTRLYSYVGVESPPAGAVGAGAIEDITAFLPAAWLADPALLELKFTYSQIPNPSIPGRHFNLFRDNTGTGIDGFLLRVTLMPRAIVTSPPSGFVQLAGAGGGTDSFTLTSVIGESTPIELTTEGDFFTVAPASFVLGANSSQIVTITGAARPEGAYEGHVSITGAGVPAGLRAPVRMLSAAAPSGPVGAESTQSRWEVASTAGEDASGSVGFTNTGTATLQGIAVSDAPWIVPQSGAITIAGAQTGQIGYTIDAAKRPDASAPLGSVAGTLSLVFLNASGGGHTALQTGQPSSTKVSVTLVHVAKPGVSATALPALGAGELALLIAGLGNRPGAQGDLLVSNRQATALSTTRIFAQESSTAAQSVSLGGLPANSAVAFPRMLSTVFASTAGAATAQLRGADVANLSVAAIQFNTSLPSGTYATALPVFRSDRGAGAAEQIMLSGLRKQGTVQTNLYVQELTGTAAEFTIDFLDAGGATVQSLPSQAVAAFGSVEMIDAVPANAIAARVTNTTTASAKMNAYALVTNATNGDAWLVTDPSVDDPASDAIVIPILTPGGGAETVVYISNRSAEAETVTVDVRSGSSRRRIVRRGSSSAPPVEGDAAAAVPIGARATHVMNVGAASGYVRIGGAGGVVSAAARSVRSADSAQTHGTDLPAVPTTRALRLGQGRRFSGVDDGSAASRAAAVPATFRANLALVETADEAATVRVTARYVFPGGTTVTGQGLAAKEYTLTPSGFLSIADLPRDVIGTARDKYGDLRSMVLDVEVIGGSGEVIPFLQLTDNGSGDTFIRVE